MSDLNDPMNGERVVSFVIVDDQCRWRVIEPSVAGRRGGGTTSALLHSVAFCRRKRALHARIYVRHVRLLHPWLLRVIIGEREREILQTRKRVRERKEWPRVRSEREQLPGNHNLHDIAIINKCKRALGTSHFLSSFGRFFHPPRPVPLCF